MNSFLKNTTLFKAAFWIVMVLNSAVILFHLLVMLQVIPYNIVWAGRLKTLEEMYVFETASILINLILILTVLAKMKAVRQGKRHRLINTVLWLFAFVFLLNTIGNLFAATTIETYIATPLTFILSVCCIKLALEPTP